MCVRASVVVYDFPLIVRGRLATRKTNGDKTSSLFHFVVWGGAPVRRRKNTRARSAPERLFVLLGPFRDGRRRRATNVKRVRYVHVGPNASERRACSSIFGFIV